LRWHWDEAYLIGWHKEPEESEGEFVAARKDGQGTIFAPTAHDLRQAMRLDYSARPVARPAGGGLPRGASRDLIGKVAEERWTA
jgi:hypothetical protein